MISIGENKSILCRGDFRPAQLYKGDKKIAGYETADFSGEGGITIENCYNDRLHNAVIYGNSIQDGIPTPEAPIEVQSVGELVTEGDYVGKYKVPVTVRGKNFVDKNTLSRVAGNYYDFYEKNGDLITIHGSKAETIYSAGGGFVRFYFPEDLPSGRYIFSVDVTLLEAGDFGASLIFYAGPSAKYSEKYTTFKNLSLNQKRKLYISGNFTNGFGTVLLRVNGCKVLIDISALQVEEGLEVTEFEPHIEPQNVSIYLNEPLRKVGEYEDYIDFEKGVIVRNVGKKVFDGTETFTTYAKCLRCATKDKSNNFLSAQINCLSNFFEAKTWDILWENVKKESGLLTVGVARSAEHIICSPYSTLPTIAEWKAQLAAWYEEGNPFTAWYAVLTTEEAIKLPKIPTFKGTTIYEIDTTIAATVSGKYKKMEE